jgi:hypothetical protein
VNAATLLLAEVPLCEEIAELSMTTTSHPCLNKILDATLIKALCECVFYWIE